MKISRHSATIWCAIIFTLCLVGAWMSGQLLKRHANLWHAGDVPTGVHARVCEAGEGVGLDCWPPRDSLWSTITLPIPEASHDSLLSLGRVEMPVAFLGLVYFVFLGVWFALLGRIETGGSKWHLVANSVASLGLLVSLVYLVAMLFGAARPCVWCYAVHIVNIPIVVAMLRFYRQHCERETAAAHVVPRAGKTTSVPIQRREVINALGVFVILTTGLWLYRQERIAIQGQVDQLRHYKTMVTDLRGDAEFLVREHFAQERVDIQLSSAEAQDAGAAQLVVFFDYECPSCFCNSQWLREQAPRIFNDRLTVAIRHYPLSDECNPQVGGNMHPNACTAARAAEAARNLGGETAFWKMHDLLLQNRRRLGDLSFEALAEQVGLDRSAFIRELKSEQVEATLLSHSGLAAGLGVNATPTTFLNGRQVSRLCQTPAFWDSIAQRHAAGTLEALTSAEAATGLPISRIDGGRIPE